VAVARDAHHEAAEDEGDDDTLDHPDEDVRQHFHRSTDVGPGPHRVVQVADDDARDRGDDDPVGQAGPAQGCEHGPGEVKVSVYPARAPTLVSIPASSCRY